MARTGRRAGRQQERLQHREAILAAAADLIAARGYSGCTMQEIAARVGCSVGYLYRHFTSKLTLARVLVDREIGQLEEIVLEVQALGLPPLETYRRQLEALSRYACDRRALVRVFTSETVLRHLPEAEARYRRFRDRDRELFARAQAAGQMGAVDPELLSHVMHGMVDALMGHLVALDDTSALLRLPDLVFTLIIDPLRPRAPADRPQPKGSPGEPNRA